MSDTLTELQAALETIQSKIARLEKHLGPLRREAEALKLSIDVLARLNGNGVSGNRNGQPETGVLPPATGAHENWGQLKIGDAIEALFAEVDGVPLRLSDIIAGLNDRGRAVEGHSVRGTLSAERKRFESAGRGIWKLKVQSEEGKAPDD